jgi:hypothetical protein
LIRRPFWCQRSTGPPYQATPDLSTGQRQGSLHRFNLDPATMANLPGSVKIWAQFWGVPETMPGLGRIGFRFGND